jgi:hypothetical protein
MLKGFQHHRCQQSLALPNSWRKSYVSVEREELFFKQLAAQCETAVPDCGVDKPCDYGKAPGREGNELKHIRALLHVQPGYAVRSRWHCCCSAAPHGAAHKSLSGVHDSGGYQRDAMMAQCRTAFRA